jgi:hypothetical protein
MRVLLKLNFTKSQLLLRDMRDIDCLLLFRFVQKLRVYLFVLYKTVYENIVYV